MTIYFPISATRANPTPPNRRLMSPLKYLPGQPQPWAPKGRHICGHRMIAVIIMGFPLPFVLDIAAPGHQQVTNAPDAVAKGSPTAPAFISAKARQIQRRKEGATAGEK